MPLPEKRTVGNIRPVWGAVTRLAVICLSTCLTTACVATTSGNFTASSQAALQDYLQLGAAYLRQGDLVNAQRHLDNAEALDPDNAATYGIRALLNSQSGDRELAENNFQKALQLNGRDSQTRNNYAAFLYDNGRYKEAYEQLQTVVQDTEYRNRSQAFENLGLVALRLDEDAAALAAFDRAVQLNPNQARSLLELSELSLARGDINQAQLYHQQYLTVVRFYSLSDTAHPTGTAVYQQSLEQ